MERVVFDTDIYIDWLREGAREELIVEGPFLRYMSTVAGRSHGFVKYQ